MVGDVGRGVQFNSRDQQGCISAGPKNYLVINVRRDGQWLVSANFKSHCEVGSDFYFYAFGNRVKLILCCTDISAKCIIIYSCYTIHF